MSRPFIPAGELSRAFYAEAVRPLLSGQPHSAALLGWGSDVLGYDTERSTDHGWGPRLLVFLDDRASAAEFRDRLDATLPETFRSWPVRFGWDAVESTHHVSVRCLGDWLVDHIGVDATAGMSLLDWLLTPQHQLLGVVAGPVFADDSGDLESVRRALSWYPDQLWRWLVACQWLRLAQEEAFVARTAEVGDDTGSRVVAARLVRDMMRLALLLDRRYAPYTKWLGTAFSTIPDPDGLPRLLAAALRADGAAEREMALARSYTVLAQRFNAAALTDPVDPTTRAYHSRPADVLLAERFANACLATVTDAALLALPLIGAVDQVADSTNLLTTPHTFRRLAGLYAAAARTG